MIRESKEYKGKLPDFVIDYLIDNQKSIDNSPLANLDAKVLLSLVKHEKYHEQRRINEVSPNNQKYS